MRVIAASTLWAFAAVHEDARGSIDHWLRLARAADWARPLDVLLTFPKAKVLNAERVRFQIHGGAYRLVVAFDWSRSIAFVKFIGTHAAYDRIDAPTVDIY